MKLSLGALGLALALGLVVSKTRRRVDLRGRTAVVCGGSRGLGLAVARELARRGCRVAICARSSPDLERARAEVAAHGGQVYAAVCDLRQPRDVQAFLADVTAMLGPVDVLVANAATISVGPIETLDATDFEDAMQSIFKTSLNAALGVLPRMRARGRGTIAFVTSIGGKVAVPHLAPYTSAKFAEVGFADALRAEVADDGVRVLTIVPGLMRTGSYVHGTFKGDPEREYAWFGTSANLPLLSIDADRAARLIVQAIERGKSQLVYTLPARIAVRTHDLVPGLYRFVTALAARYLPRALSTSDTREGVEVEATSTSAAVAALRKRTGALAPRFGQ